MCVLKEGTETFRFSARDVIACDENNYKCTGGYVQNVIRYGAEKGFISEKAFPWTDDREELEVCPDQPNQEREDNQ